MKNGVNQSGRMLPALDPTAVVPDERSLLDLVRFTLDYSDSIHYYSHQNRPLGTWKPFLLDDPIFIIALIATTSFESNKLRQDDLALKAEHKGKHRHEYQEAMAVNVLSMAQSLGYWERLFTDCNYVGPLMKEVVNSRRFVDSIIAELLFSQHRFHAADFPGVVISEKKSTHEVNFTECFKAVYKNLVYIVELAGRKFDELVHEQSGGHQPHMGLLLAALRLFEEVQTDMNGMTQKHLDFYYQRLLQQLPKPAGMLRILVGLVPKAGVALLPENSDFSLFFPSKKTLSLQNRFQTELGQAKIVELRTLYKSDYFPFSSGLNGERVTLNGIYDTVLYQGDGKSELAFQGEMQSDFPLVMGEDQSQKGLNQKTMSTSMLGMVVSSPVLLVEGIRHDFRLTFELVPESARQFRLLLAELLREKERVIGGNHQHSDQTLKNFIQSFLNEAFTVALTTAHGWKTLDFAQVELTDEGSKLVLKLEPEGVDELPVAYDPQLHGGISATNWPCVRLLLNNSAHYPPYGPLRILEVAEVEILTLSKRVGAGFECSNPLGKLNTSTPFLPFGSLPTKDSYLKINDPLILNKYLRRLSLKISWLGYPEGRTGFIGHYRAYPEMIDNQSFQALVSIRSTFGEKENLVPMTEQKVLLFDTEEKSDGEYLRPKKGIDVNLDLVDRSILSPPAPVTTGQESPVYLALKLTDPSPFAFGHEKYSELYAETSLYNGRHPKRPSELPRPPYTPQIEKIEFTYSNHTKENLSRRGSESGRSIQIFHLFPFGHSQVFPASGSGRAFLIPQLRAKGNLLIGLADLSENETVNLGFKLHPAYFIHTVTHPPRVAWEYLERNQWLPLENLLLEDSTQGMLQSGVVRIKLPSRLDFDNTRLTSGRFWLRVSMEGNTDINSRLISIFTNAAWLSQVPGGPVELNPEELRETVTVISSGNVGLNAVNGPYHIDIPTFQKSRALDRGRVSELMRHRNRGITTWDLERLVLERFPQIGRVMVYGRSDFPLHLVKGSNVQVVVIPHSPLDAEFRTSGFLAPFGLLQEIKQYLQSFLSSFTKLEVCNPVFEKLKIRAAVKFCQTQLSGYYRDLLERELIEFLSPNPRDFQEEKGFVNSIYKAEIQSFIESRSYVELVTGLSVLQIVEVQGSFKVIDTADSEYQVEQLRTISPYAILTSAETHLLTSISVHEPQDPALSSIGDLSIDSDFIIKPSHE